MGWRHGWTQGGGGGYFPRYDNLLTRGLLVGIHNILRVRYHSGRFGWGLPLGQSAGVGPIPHPRSGNDLVVLRRDTHVYFLEAFGD